MSHRENSVAGEIKLWARSQEHRLRFLLSPLTPAVTLWTSLKLSMLPSLPFAKQGKLSLCYQQHEGKGDKAVRTLGLVERKMLQEENYHVHTHEM